MWRDESYWLSAEIQMMSIKLNKGYASLYYKLSCSKKSERWLHLQNRQGEKLKFHQTCKFTKVAANLHSVVNSPQITNKITHNQCLAFVRLQQRVPMESSTDEELFFVVETKLVCQANQLTRLYIFFSSSLTLGQNKLECLALATWFQG